MIRDVVLCGLFASMALLTGGCVYMTPGRGADLSAVVADKDAIPASDASVAAAMDKKPQAKLPTQIAVVRIESSGYQSDTADALGYGNFSVVTNRDIEDPAVIEKWQTLPQVQGITSLNRFLLPDTLQSDRDLRHAAAEIHADILLVYTIDTSFTQPDQPGVLPLVTLRVASDRNIQVSSTATAVLMDTRNGYIYGVAEGTQQRDGSTITWSTEASVDDARRSTEAAAFKKMAAQVETIWARVLKQNQTPAKTVE